jgi:hypothetical protein
MRLKGGRVEVDRVEGDNPDEVLTGCLMATLEVVGAWFLFGYARRKDRQWLRFEDERREEDWLREIALVGAAHVARRWNAQTAEFTDDGDADVTS